MARSLASRIRAANAALLAKGNLDAVGEYFTKTYVVHLTDHDLGGGHAGVRRFLTTIRGAFSDLHVKVDVFVEDENRVAWQRTVRATHRGDFMSFPASGRRITWRDMFVSRFRGELIAEEWAVSDLAERLLLARKR